MNCDHNLLFAKLARRVRQITEAQLQQAQATLKQQPSKPLAAVLLAQGSLTDSDIELIQSLAERLIAKHRGVLEAIQALEQDPGTRKIAGGSTEETQATATKDPAAPATSEFSVSGKQPDDESSGESDDLEQTSEELQPQSPMPGESLGTEDYEPETRSRYTLTRVHGKGGLGRVWLALDSQLHREVALKEVLPHREDRTQIARLVREAQVTGQLEHPNIIPVYELEDGSDEGRAFYTMRFLRGKTLNDRIKEYHASKRDGLDDPLELPQLLQSFVGICNGIAYAHSRGIIHRDLKPQNVMLGSFGEVILLDWGLAKQIGDSESDERDVRFDRNLPLKETQDGKVLGSPAYMSPEQADGRVAHIDERSDIYGLGTILFAILTGSAPHKIAGHGSSVKSTMDLLRRISSGSTPKASERDPLVARPLEAICLKAMARERDGRYQNATELSQDIQRWLADEPVSVYPEPLRDRVIRWVRKNRSWAFSSITALLLITVVSSVSALLIHQARKAESTALLAEREARTEATRRFRDARRTVDRSFNELSEVLKYLPGGQPVRARLLEEAAEDYKRFAQEKGKDPTLVSDSARASIKLGDVYRLLGQFENAQQAYTQAETQLLQLSATQPNEPELVLDLATLRSKQGEFHTITSSHDDAEDSFRLALDSLDSLIANNPTNTQYQFARSATVVHQVRLLKETGRYDEAITLLETQARTFADMVDQSGDAESIQALATTRQELAQLLQLQGQNDLAAFQIEQAIKHFDTLVAERDDFPPYLEGMASARVIQANIHMVLGRTGDVIESYSKSLEDYEDLLLILPGLPRYRENLALSQTNLAQILHRQGRNREAHQHAASALSELLDLVRFNPPMARYHEQKASCSTILGMILRDLNEDELSTKAFQGAIEEFRALSEAISDAPAYRLRLAVSLSGLGRLYYKMGNYANAASYFEEAIKEFEDVLRELPDNPVVLDSLAFCCSHFADMNWDLEESEQATKLYERVRTVRQSLGNDPEHLHSRAWFYTFCRSDAFCDNAAALEAARKAKELVPENPKFWFTLGIILCRQALWQDGLQAFAEAANRRQSPSSFDSFGLALAHHGSAQTNKAIEHYKHAVEIMQLEQPGNIELGMIRREVEAALGIQPQRD